MPAPFELQSVIHLVRPLGARAHDLDELRDGIAVAPDSSLFVHTIQAQLRHATAHGLPPDDFSSWVNGVVQDRETAERLAFDVHQAGGSPATLRAALLATLDTLSREERRRRDSPREGAFVFLDVDTVAVPTGERVHDCASLSRALAHAEPGVWFYHLVEQPWLAPNAPSLLDWARMCGDRRTLAELEEVGRPDRPFAEARERLTRRWARPALAQRVAQAAGRSEDERRDAAHDAVAGLVRRLRTPEDGRP